MSTQRTPFILVVCALTLIAAVYFYTQPLQVAPTPDAPIVGKRMPAPAHAETEPVTPSQALAEPDSNLKPAPAPSPRVGRSVDWHKYPGTLNDQALHALANQDGEMAADVAQLLADCKRITIQLKPKPIQKLAPESVLGLQKEYANCQTIPGDLQPLRIRLLSLARDKNVVGVAIESFRLGITSPQVLMSVVHDAQAGEVASMVSVADSKPEEFGITADTQATLRYALELAAQDPEIGKLVSFYLDLAESTAFQLGNSKSAKFDHSGLSEAARNEARAIAERVVKRVKNSSSL